MFTPKGAATVGSARAPKFVALNAPDGLRFSEQTADLAVAPDGRSIVVAGNAEDGTTSLYVRRFDDPAWRNLPGTEGAYFPFWSPDGRSVGFFAGNKLKKVAIAGGGSQSLCDAAAGRGGTWNKDGVIVFAPGNFGPLMQVKAEGGPVTEATAVDTAHGEVGHRFPLFLPDGDHFLYASIPAREQGHEIYLGSLHGKERTLVVNADGLPSFVPPDQLIFPRGKMLYAQTFDPSTGRVSGELRPIVEAGRASGFMASQASSAAAGAVVFAPLIDAATELSWFSIEGAQGETLPLPGGQYTEIRLSPDETRALTSRFDPINPLKAGSEVWLVDLARKNGTRITFDPGFEFSPFGPPTVDRSTTTVTRPAGI
jgi:Tol biopolymer transport system component